MQIFQKRKKTVIISAIVALLILVLFAVTGIYRYIFSPNVKTGKEKIAFLHIPTGATFEVVMDSLLKNQFLRNPGSFRWLAARREYDQNIRPGRYRISHGMSNLELVRLLKSGKQEPVMVVFNNIRTREDFAGRIGRQIEADSMQLLELLRNPDYLDEFGVTPATVFRLFIPNSYELYWNTSADQFIRRMEREMKKFWTEDRIRKSSLTSLTLDEVVTLASIVERETNKDREKPTIAGVYINRLRQDRPLQADPTLIFALNDYTIKRVREEHKNVKSPYNTYMNKGLPPGPICLPSIASIDAVLNYERHDYMFFCAREDLSGYHAFAVTFEQHKRNAARYRTKLNQMNIR